MAVALTVMYLSQFPDFTIWASRLSFVLPRALPDMRRVAESTTLAAAIAASLATSVVAQGVDVSGQWVCTKQCAPGPAVPMLISPRIDGTLLFYANPIPPGRYRDIAEGRWIGPDTIGIRGISGAGFNRAKTVRIRSEGNSLLFEDGAEWQRY